MSRMRQAVLAIALFGTALEASAAATFEERIAALKKGQPKAIASLIDRIADCQHWSGEEPYDAERAKEMAAAMSRLRCDRLETDEAQVRKHYAREPKVALALNELKRLLDE